MSRLPAESVSTLVESLAVECRGTAPSVLAWTMAAGRPAAFCSFGILPLSPILPGVVGLSPGLGRAVFGQLVALDAVAFVVGQSHDTTGQGNGT